jgi:hypothetical protein
VIFLKQNFKKYRNCYTIYYIGTFTGSFSGMRCMIEEPLCRFAASPPGDSVLGGKQKARLATGFYSLLKLVLMK